MRNRGTELVVRTPLSGRATNDCLRWTGTQMIAWSDSRERSRKGVESFVWLRIFEGGGLVRDGEPINVNIERGEAVVELAVGGGDASGGFE